MAIRYPDSCHWPLLVATLKLSQSHKIPFKEEYDITIREDDYTLNRVHRIVGWTVDMEMYKEAGRKLGLKWVGEDFVVEEKDKIVPGQEPEALVVDLMRIVLRRLQLQQAVKIYRRSWEPGMDRVGSVSTYHLLKRIQLAVAAYIRHRFTVYNTLLSKKEERESPITKEFARAQVEAATVKGWIKLRGVSLDSVPYELSVKAEGFEKT